MSVLIVVLLAAASPLILLNAFVHFRARQERNAGTSGGESETWIWLVLGMLILAWVLALSDSAWTTLLGMLKFLTRLALLVA